MSEQTQIITQVKSKEGNIPLGVEAKHVILDSSYGGAFKDTTHTNLQDKLIQLNRSIQVTGRSGVATGHNATALGDGTKAKGNWSFTEGYLTVAETEGAHAEGLRTTAKGKYSHTEGESSVAYTVGSHAEGKSTKAGAVGIKEAGNIIIEIGESYAHAEGVETYAFGGASHAEGHSTRAYGYGTHAEGDGTRAGNSVARPPRDLLSLQDYQDQTPGIGAHAEGIGTVAKKAAAHSEGYKTIVEALASHAEGNSTLAAGSYSHAEGWETKSQGIASHTEGYTTIAQGSFSHAEGYQNEINAGARASHIEGEQNISYGYWSHVEGYDNQHILKYSDVGYQDASHIEGCHHQTSMPGIHVEGEGHKVGAPWETLENPQVGSLEGLIFSGCNRPPELEGMLTNYNVFTGALLQRSDQIPGLALNKVRRGTLIDDHGRAYTKVIGIVIQLKHDDNSIRYQVIFGGAHTDLDLKEFFISFSSEEEYTKTNLLSRGAHIQGTYSLINDSNLLHVVGNGISNSYRSNAHTIDRDGNAMFAGDINFQYTYNQWSGMNNSPTGDTITVNRSLSEILSELNDRINYLEAKG